MNRASAALLWATVVAYLGGAFINGGFDPALWGTPERALTVMVAAGLWLCVLLAPLVKPG